VNYKLPFLNIIAASLFFVWTNRAEFLRAISLPTLVLVVFWAVGTNYATALESYMWLPYLLGYGLSFSFLAVTCHRLILVGDADRHRSFKAKPGYRELRFLLWVVVIYAVEAVLEGLSWYLAKDVGGGDIGDVGDWVKQIASIPALYVLARLSLAFPAVAIDRNAGLRWSWTRTRGNGWRIFVVVGLFPWLTDMSIGLVWREEATVLEETILSVFTFIGLAIEIIALSFVYKELAKQYVSGDTDPLHTEVQKDSFHDLPGDGKGRGLDAAVKVTVVFVIGYLLIGSFASSMVDCSSERIGSAVSPNGAYRAELLGRTCKDKNKEQGLILEVGQTATPRRVYNYHLSNTASHEVELMWRSDKSLLVIHPQSMDMVEVPVLTDDIQLVLEKRVPK
jgi:hypothetical protein